MSLAQRQSWERWSWIYTRLPDSTEHTFPSDTGAAGSSPGWPLPQLPSPRAALKHSYPSRHASGCLDTQMLYWLLYIHFPAQPPTRELLLSLFYVSENGEVKSFSQDQYAFTLIAPGTSFTLFIFLCLSSLFQIIPNTLFMAFSVLVILTEME